MFNKYYNKSFWTTLPGILTGIAGLITAITGILTLLYPVGCIDHKPPDWKTATTPIYDIYTKDTEVIRPEIPTIMVVTRGGPDVSAIVESIIEKQFHESSFPVSGVDEMLSILEGYGRYEIPLNALQEHKLNANILVYVIVDSTGIEPLKFYGKIMDQYSSIITIKLIDTATKNMVCPPITSSARYTTLNMQDNIREVTEQMVANIPKKIEDFWNK